MKLRRSRSVRLIAALLVAPVALTPMLAAPAYAQFGFGGIVYDPSNYAQNVLTAARSLQQITNQITSLQNQAQSLINQARNLASLLVCLPLVLRCSMICRIASTWLPGMVFSSYA